MPKNWEKKFGLEHRILDLKNAKKIFSTSLKDFQAPRQAHPSPQESPSFHDYVSFLYKQDLVF